MARPGTYLLLHSKQLLDKNLDLAPSYRRKPRLRGVKALAQARTGVREELRFPDSGFLLSPPAHAIAFVHAGPGICR